MRLKFFILLGVVCGLATAGFGQSTRDVAAPKPPPPKYQSFKKQKKSFFLFRIFKSKKQKTDAHEVAEFRKRMAQRLDEKALEAEKASRKPQYTNPLYFGHKKPPKKRKAGKKKFCKECGLVH